jgi:uncharacterized protein YqfB (UPF0267 family)
VTDPLISCHNSFQINPSLLPANQSIHSNQVVERHSFLRVAHNYYKKGYFMELGTFEDRGVMCLRKVGSHSETQHDILEEMNDSTSFMYLIKYKFHWSEYIYPKTRKMIYSLGLTTGFLRRFAYHS